MPGRKPKYLPPTLNQTHVVVWFNRALREHRLVQITYRANSTHETSERIIEPIELHEGDRAYLSAYCRLRADVREFRLDRILALEVLAQTFTPRQGLLLEEDDFWPDGEEDYEARVIFRQPALHMAGDAKYEHGLLDEEPLPDGNGLIITFMPEHMGAFARWLLGFGPHVEVQAPAVLHQVLVRLSAEAYEFYHPISTPRKA